MNWVAGLIIYILVWWVVFFAMLPLGVRGQFEDQDADEIIGEPGAPTHPQLRRKILLTSAIAAVLWILIAGFIALILPRLDI